MTTKDEQGRHIGEDGFVVPATFAEFHARFPGWARMMAWKCLKRASREDIDDLTNDIWTRLIRLKAVERYDPDKTGGKVNAKLFFSYMMLCARNTATSSHKARQTEPTTIATTVWLDGLPSTGDEYNGGLSAEYLLASTQPYDPDATVNVMLLDGFARYLQAQGEPELATFYSLLREGHTQDAASNAVGLGARATGAMQRLKKIAAKYQEKWNYE